MTKISKKLWIDFAIFVISSQTRCNLRQQKKTLRRIPLATGIKYSSLCDTIRDSSYEINVTPTHQRSDLPVAVDGDSDDEQHGHDDSRDDDVERQIIFLLVLHRAHHPLPFPKLDLWINTQRENCIICTRSRHSRETFISGRCQWWRFNSIRQERGQST